MSLFMGTQEDVQKLLDKVKKLEKGEKLDLSSDEDLSIGIMNLVAIEEHLFFTAEKTGKDEYWELLNQVREMRKVLLKKIIKDYEGEVWCISKHLLAASIRLMEVGTKMLGKGDKRGGKEMFDRAYKLYSLFWGLNLGLVNTEGLKEVKGGDKMEFISEEKQPVKKGSASVLDKLSVVVNKVLDCCRE
jgi:hypothetical protein